MGLRIIFMGTPEFAVVSLDALYKSEHEIVAVVTVQDKPAGRGQKMQESPIKKYAVENNIPVLQPDKLKDEKFIEELKSFNADLFVVVAFRMLPEVVWNMPPKGTFNLHGSLLPQYRGAAPINRAVMNGEKETGVTTFFIEKEIDTGNILFTEKTQIAINETAGDVHDRLMNIGAKLVVKTADAIESGIVKPISQNALAEKIEIKTAPKIFKDDCRINWNNEVTQTYNHIRGLSPYPTAWTILHSDTQITVKIFECSFKVKEQNIRPGTILTDNKTYIHVAAKNGFISIKSLQLEGKKRLSTDEFLRGFHNVEKCWFE